MRVESFVWGCAIFLLMLSAGMACAQSVPVVTGDARVDKLLNQMTLEEKLKLIHGTQEDPQVYQGQAGYLGGIPRLGIPGMRFADGPPGVLTRHPSQAETATMGVAATFSRKIAEANGLVIGREDRALGIDVSLQPFVNIDRDMEFGRGYNTFGEDPFLTGEIAAAEIKGIQSQHVMAQVKHFVGYDSDGNSTWIDDQTLHEVYVAPFDAAIQAGVALDHVLLQPLNGTYACGNEATLTKILRNEIGFKGFVTSDWGATHAVKFIRRRAGYGDARRASSRRRLLIASVFLRCTADSASRASRAEDRRGRSGRRHVRRSHSRRAQARARRWLRC